MGRFCVSSFAHVCHARKSSSAWLIAALLFAMLIVSCSVAYGFSVTVLGSDPLAGTPTGSGVYNPGATVTVHANTAPHYTFVDWTRDGFGGFDVASRSADYTFQMPVWDITLYGNYASVPEPSSLLVLASGIGLVVVRLRRRRLVH